MENQTDDIKIVPIEYPEEESQEIITRLERIEQYIEALPVLQVER